jgi:hypothetical protein
MARFLVHDAELFASSAARIAAMCSDSTSDYRPEPWHVNRVAPPGIEG